MLKKIKFTIIIILSIVFLISNVNAQNINRLPFLGSIVNVDNIKTIFQSGNNELDMNIPKIKYNEGIDDTLNEEIKSYIEKIVESFFKDYNDKNHHYTKIDYEIIADNEEWFTLKLDVTDIMASSDNYFKFYHIDKFNNEIINFANLFQYHGYKEAIINDIDKQMIDRMKENKSLTYWINNNDPLKISDDQNFYFNKQGNLVIVFREYEVAPGSMGPQEFIIENHVYNKYLKARYIK